MIALSAIDDYLDQPMRDLSWYGEFTHDELVELGRRWGILHQTPPRDYQRVGTFLVLKYQSVLLFYDPGLGKALPLSELVLTPSGFVPMSKIRVGSKVIGQDGLPTNVVGVFPQGKKEIYEMTFSDGAKVRCTEDHLWNVRMKGSNAKEKWKTLPLKAFKDNLRRPYAGCPKGESVWFVPMAKPVQFRNKINPPEINPYLLGVLLGDGSLGKQSCSITSGDPEIIETVRTHLPIGCDLVLYSQDKGCATYGISGQDGHFRKLIRKLNLNVGSHHKFVPKEYLFGTVSERLEMLRGLLDTDGYALSHRSFEFGSVCEQLAKDVQFLTRSLGGSASLKKNVKKYKGKPFNLYRVYGRTPVGINPFKLKRKAEKYDLGKLSPNRAVIKVEKIGEENCQCIKVANPDGLFITSDFVVTHNTKMALDSLSTAINRGEARRGVTLVPSVSNVESWTRQAKIHAPELRVRGVIGTREKREKILQEDCDLIVMTYAAWRSFTCKRRKAKKVVGDKEISFNKMGIDDEYARQLESRFDFFIADECTEFKNGSSTTARLLARMKEFCPFRVGLTGTPFGKNVADLFSQFYVIDGGETFGDQIQVFYEAFFKEAKSSWGEGTEFKFDRSKADLLHRRLKNRSIVYRAEDCLDLPKLVQIERPVIISEEALEYYQTWKEKIIASDRNYSVIQNAYIQMRQMTSGYMTLKGEHGEDRIIQFPKNPKLDEIDYLLDEINPNKKILLFHVYLATGKIITDHLAKRGVGFTTLNSQTPARQKETLESRMWDDPSIQVLVASESAAFGLNLQCAPYTIFYETTSSPIRRRQLSDRNYRQGQTETTFHYDLVALNTVDERILDALADGQDLISMIMSGKSNLKKIFG